jgi:hypothetical protein
MESRKDVKTRYTTRRPLRAIAGTCGWTAWILLEAQNRFRRASRDG